MQDAIWRSNTSPEVQCLFGLIADCDDSDRERSSFFKQFGDMPVAIRRSGKQNFNVCGPRVNVFDNIGWRMLNFPFAIARLSEARLDMPDG
jgi:hypothetical protein